MKGLLMKEFLFVYGTLQNPAVQQFVFGRPIAGTYDILEGFTRSTISLGTETYFIVEQEDGSTVEGLLLEITPEELTRADRYETSDYRRFHVTLRSGQEAWVYGK